MKHTKKEKKLINEWLDRYDDELTTFSTPLKDFKKIHNLIEELEVGKWYKVGFCMFNFQEDFYFGMNLDNKEWFKYNTPINKVIKVGITYELMDEYEVIKNLTWYAENVMKYNHEKPNYKCLKHPIMTEAQNSKLTYHINYGNEFWVKSEDNNYTMSNCLMKNGEWAKVIEEQPIKPAYKSKGGEHGKRIIQKLVELGGVNDYNYVGRLTKEFYFINEDNYIRCFPQIPQGYTECFLEEDRETLLKKVENLQKQLDNIQEQLNKLINGYTK